MKKLLLIVLSLLMLLCFTAAFADSIDDEDDDDMLSLEELIAWKQSQMPECITLEDMYDVQTGNLIEEYYGIEILDAKSEGMTSFMTCDKTMFVVGQTSTLSSHTTGGAGDYTYNWVPYYKAMSSTSSSYYNYGERYSNKNVSITPDDEYRYLIYLTVTDSAGNYISYYGKYETVTTASLSDPTTLGGKIMSVIASETNDSMTDRQKALACHEWLTHNAKYDQTLQNHDPEGVLLMGSGVCESYARAYQMMMSELGIPCIYVTSQSMRHAWNMIYVDGGWYHVDVTWDDPIFNGRDTIITGGEQTTYFCATDAQMSDHSWNEYDGNGQIVPASGRGPMYPEDGGSGEEPGGEDPGEEEPDTDVTLAIGTNTVTINGTTVVKAAFTAVDEGNYTFETTGSLDTMVSVYTTAGTLLGSNDDSGEGYNFRIMLNLKAGDRIILEIKAYSDSYSGDVPLIVSYSTDLAAPTGSVTTLNGYTFSTGDIMPRLLFFNNYTCGNCSAMLKMLQGYDLSTVGAIIAEGCNATQQQAKECVAGLDIYGAVMGYKANSLMWSMLRAAGFSDSSVATPVVFYLDENNNIINYTTGYDGSIVSRINEYLGVKLEKVDTSGNILTLPAGLTELDSEALQGTSAEIIVIPSGVNDLYTDAFRDCDKLRMIINHSDLPILLQDVIVTDIPA